MADDPTPSEISRREFEAVRRGYDQQEVRGFLHELSALVDRLQRSEAELRERATGAESRLANAEQPDEAAMLELLGEETTRVLTSAREAATDIRSKAEQSAERIIAEATAQAAQTRSLAVTEADQRLADAKAEGEQVLGTARGELERRTHEAEEAAERILGEASSQAQALRDEAVRDLASARDDAARVVEAARAEGKGMLSEAQAVRERVLRDLAARRKKARQQIEQLQAGRERLLQAYDVVRNTVDEATTELAASVTDARVAAAAAGRRVDAEPEPTAEQLDEELATARLAQLPIVDPPAVDDPEPPAAQEEPAEAAPASPPPPPAPEPEPEPAPFVRIPPGRQAREEAEAAAKAELAGRPAPTKPKLDGPPMPEADDFEPIDPPRARGVSSAPADAPPEPEPEPEPAPEPAAEEPMPDEPGPEPAPEPAPASPSRAQAVFAQLHAEAAAPDEEPEPDAGAPDLQAFVDRDDTLVPIERDLARRIKRALADEQNKVLDQLRRAKPAGVDDLYPAVEAHLAHWIGIAREPLEEAAAAGARWVGGAAVATAELADELARVLVLPLRERIDRGFVAADGNLDDVADRVRALYREWKNQRLPDAVPHAVATAYAKGVFEAMPSGAKVHWVVDPQRGPCPDCDDNVLAGTLVKGEEFPTGNRCAPAHPGCRCLVLAVAE